MDRFGIVCISVAYTQLPDRSPFTGYWDRGEPPEMLEDGPGWDDVEDAIEWGRARATRVVVRLGPNESSMYSAGDEPLTRFTDGTGPAVAPRPPLRRHSCTARARVACQRLPSLGRARLFD